MAKKTSSTQKKSKEKSSIKPTNRKNETVKVGKQEFTKDKLLQVLKTMLQARTVDNKAMNLLRQGKTFFQQRNGKLYLDLKKALNVQLVEAGIKKEHLEISGLCTSCNNDLFFSHRAEKGKTGRTGVMIGMKEE